MNSPIEDRLREALAEAGATVDASTLSPLRSSGRSRVRVDFRLLAAAGAVVLAGAVTAAVLVSPGDEQRVAVANPPVEQKDDTELSVFLCTKELAKNPDCPGGATMEQTQAIHRALTATPGVIEVLYVTRELAYKSFHRDYADDKALLDAIDVTDLPPSFQVKLKPGADLKTLRVKMKSIGGVMGSTSDGEVAKMMASTPVENAHIAVFLCREHSIQVSCGATVAPDSTKNPPTFAEDGKAITPAQRSALTKEIDTMPGVQSARFENQQQAYENFKRSFKDNKTLLRSTKASDMPESFRLQMSPDADWDDVTAKLQRLPGVAHVSKNRCATKRLVFLSRFGVQPPESNLCASWPG
ncbi:permease-like cell division protein FtsX [Nonomuraea sp. NPDC049158]|uniref:permease-like cell division protein FtsX n=1 Tax=Nonomuraea sp. NPDC049158 TaxID=3155649 RepID=UPI0033DC584D